MTDAIVSIESEAAARVAWVSERIIEEDYEPGKPGTVWAGRDALVSRTSTELHVPLDEAEKVVELAVAEIWAESRPDDRSAQKFIALKRLGHLRKHVWKLIRDGVQECTQKVEEVEDELNPGKKRSVWRDWKRKKTGVDIAGTARLLEILRFECELRGLMDHDGSGESVVGALIEHLDEMADGKTEKKVTVSVSQAIKSTSSDKLGKAAQAKMQAMLDSVSKRTKRIESKVIDGTSGTSEQDG